ncbi:MAG TPA: CdaR family protein, partial [Anaerolineae bacterium]|nr:CdaR family protein [Anaerolineae bacterium]
GVKESFTRRVSLNLPEGVTVYSAGTSGQTVLVQVEVTPIIGGKTMQPKIEWLGLRSGYVVNITPSTVDVILSGPLPELQALQVEDVHVVVNLFGLGPGRFQVVPTVQLPDGSNLKVERMAPDAVEVTITAETAKGTATP